MYECLQLEPSDAEAPPAAQPPLEEASKKGSATKVHVMILGDSL
jgi:hypothetical protein